MSIVKHKQDFVFEALSSKPIKIVDMLSAKSRVDQWIYQQKQVDQVELAIAACKYYQRMNLIYIYEDFRAYITREYYGDTAKQEQLERKLERDMFCALQKIVPRTERRRKESAIRIRCLIDAGITFDQIASTGMPITDFEADNPYYNKFLLGLNLQDIRHLLISRSEDLLLDPSSVEPATPKTMLNILAKSINKISNSKIQAELDESDDIGSGSMELDE